MDWSLMMEKLLEASVFSGDISPSRFARFLGSIFSMISGKGILGFLISLAVELRYSAAGGNCIPWHHSLSETNFTQKSTTLMTTSAPFLPGRKNSKLD